MLTYQDELHQLVGGQIRIAGLTSDGYPYLVVAKPEIQKIFYVLAQCDAEGNGSGFLHLSERKLAAPKEET